MKAFNARWRQENGSVQLESASTIKGYRFRLVGVRTHGKSRGLCDGERLRIPRFVGKTPLGREEVFGAERSRRSTMRFRPRTNKFDDSPLQQLYQRRFHQRIIIRNVEAHDSPGCEKFRKSAQKHLAVSRLHDPNDVRPTDVAFSDADTRAFRRSGGARLDIWPPLADALGGETSNSVPATDEQNLEDGFRMVVDGYRFL